MSATASNFLSTQLLSAEVVERCQHLTAPLIERGIHTLGPEGVVRLIEAHAGGDLQYIRTNGIVVGGLAGWRASMRSTSYSACSKRSGHA